MRTYSPGLNPRSPCTYPYVFVMTPTPHTCVRTLWIAPSRKLISMINVSMYNFKKWSNILLKVCGIHTVRF